MSIFRLNPRILTQLFKEQELGLAKNLELLLAKVFKEVLKISDDFVIQIEAKAESLDDDQSREQHIQAAAWIKSVVFNSL